MYISVIIPAYNEEDRLPETLAATITYFQDRCPGDFEVLIVDDGSKDNTAKVASEIAANHPGTVEVLNYDGNRGKGYAVRFGMLRATGRWRLFCDADLATPVEEYDVLRAAMDSADAEIGIGSRPLKESRLMVRQPIWREYLGRSFNKVVQLAVPGIDDTQCGFKLFEGTTAHEVFSRCRLDGFAFDVESLYVARKLGYRIVEVPIRWSHKEGSKVNMLRDGTRMLLDLLTVYRIHHTLAKLVTAEPAPKH